MGKPRDRIKNQIVKIAATFGTEPFTAAQLADRWIDIKGPARVPSVISMVQLLNSLVATRRMEKADEVTGYTSAVGNIYNVRLYKNK